jgi:anthranilate phosphoribosyltransferase
MIREAIGAVVEGRSLTSEEASAAMGEIMSGEATPAQIAALVVALRMKGETPEEIAGMARTMRQNALRVEVPGLLVDTCGTGGDGSGTFNISTAAALVAAAAGLKVAKHGNRAASSTCGSADVLEVCGVRIDLGPAGVQRCIEEVGIGFMFAQTFHPAMRHAGPPRREIGVRTVFNILGPLTNPAGAQAQVLGVADAGLGRLMADVLLNLRTHRAMVVCGEDGVDEITLSGPTDVWQVSDGAVHHYLITPYEFGLDSVPLDRLKGGTPDENRILMERVLGGQPGPLHDAVALNAGAALFVGGAAEDLRDGVRMAKEILGGGAALRKLRDFAEASQRAEG